MAVVQVCFSMSVWPNTDFTTTRPLPPAVRVSMTAPHSAQWPLASATEQREPARWSSQGLGHTPGEPLAGIVAQGGHRQLARLPLERHGLQARLLREHARDVFHRARSVTRAEGFTGRVGRVKRFHR